MTARIDFAADVRRLLARSRAAKPATGTERAACRLALGVVRADALRGGPIWTYLGLCGADHALGMAGIDYGLPPPIEWRWRWDDVGDTRLLRARLALYLRALLRADAGDCGPWWCPSCGVWCDAEDDHCYRYGYDEWAIPVTPSRRITPLWERARAVT